MDLPYLHLAQRLLSVAVEIRNLETKLNIHFPKVGLEGQKARLERWKQNAQKLQ